MSLESGVGDLGALFRDRTLEHGVVGASLAVGRGDELVEFATGLVNSETGVEATPDAVFQIGSITKLFTATLAMQFVDNGLVELDAPVQRVLPEFQVSDEVASQEITLAQLLRNSP